VLGRDAGQVDHHRLMEVVHRQPGVVEELVVPAAALLTPPPTAATANSPSSAKSLYPACPPTNPATTTSSAASGSAPSTTDRPDRSCSAPPAPRPASAWKPPPRCPFPRSSNWHPEPHTTSHGARSVPSRPASSTPPSRSTPRAACGSGSRPHLPTDSGTARRGGAVRQVQIQQVAPAARRLCWCVGDVADHLRDLDWIRGHLGHGDRGSSGHHGPDNRGHPHRARMEIPPHSGALLNADKSR
jgi:hypothetical protein